MPDTTHAHTRTVCRQKRELIARSGYLLVNRNHRKWERRLVDLVEGFAVLYVDEHAKQRGDALEVHIPYIPWVHSSYTKTYSRACGVANP